MAKVDERDHVDDFLESEFLEEIPNLDLTVEGIVDRIMGISRRFKRSLEETLSEHGLSHADWHLLGALARKKKPRSAGKLAEVSDLSSGAMTNRLDRLEEAGLVRRLRDPSDRRGVLVELTAKGRRAYNESAGRGGQGGTDHLCAQQAREGAAECAAPPPHDRVRTARSRIG